MRGLNLPEPGNTVDYAGEKPAQEIGPQEGRLNEFAGSIHAEIQQLESEIAFLSTELSAAQARHGALQSAAESLTQQPAQG